MRLTSFTDYGLRILMCMAGDPERLFTTEVLARELGLSRNHLLKVVRELARADILEARKGARGGIFFARSPEDVTIGEVVRCLESRSPLVECFRDDGGNCSLFPSCRLRHHLQAAREAFLAELDRTSLADCAWPVSPEADFLSEARRVPWHPSL
ncbi:MAG TPA: Rrf2 family transcriptional regulator [Kiloniellales bacterium]|nr:Rrf2 family transcriptional regulator [Kiloniellales bacterium]